jgi:hypothetical protein
MSGRAAPWLLLALLAALPAAAQQHGHGPAGSGVAIAHDLPPDGRAYAGGLAHFAVVILGDDAVPDFHQQVHARVTLNGGVLYETTPDSGHDYDGTHAFDVVFPETGSYAVEALDESGKALARFEGYVVQPAAGASTLQVDGPEAATAGQLARFTVRTLDGAGAIVPHSDALFEVRQGAALLFRAKTHTHTEEQVVQYAFPAPGTYTVCVTDYLAYPSGDDALEFAPQSVEREVTVAPGLPAAGAPAAPNPGQARNAVVLGETRGGNLTLVGTFDPYTIVGPYTQARLSALVLDPATGSLVQHVDFKATLLGPGGQALFASETLHEYDGIFELATVQPLPGTYRLIVDASRGAWSGHVELAYTVLPPALPVAVGVPPQPGAGPVLFEATGLDGGKAGTPLSVGLYAHTLAGQPFPHSEVDAQVVDAAGVAVLTTKLHTHDDGRFAFTAALPEGAYTLRLSPFPLDPTATPAFHGPEVGTDPSFAFTVAPGPGFAGALPNEAASQDAPGLTVAALLAGLAALAAFLRR